MARKKKRIPPRRSRPVIRKKAVSSALAFIFKLIPFIIVAGIVGICLKATASLLIDSDYFKIKAIDIKADNSGVRLAPAEIGLSSKKGLNIFSIDLKACESDIRNGHPELKDVAVRRVLPDLLEVSYQIRRPFCQVDSGYFYLVSEDAVVLPNPLVAAKPELCIITGINISERAVMQDRQIRSKSLQRAISLLKEIKASNFSTLYEVVKIDIYDPRSPAIYIEDGTRIEIGEHSFKQRYRVLQEILDDLESKNRKARIIDLRFDDVVVIPR